MEKIPVVEIVEEIEYEISAKIRVPIDDQEELASILDSLRGIGEAEITSVRAIMKSKAVK